MNLHIIINLVLVLFLLFYWMATFLLLYHLTRFGIGVQPKRFSALFLFGSLVLSFAVIFFYNLVDFNLFL